MTDGGAGWLRIDPPPFHPKDWKGSRERVFDTLANKARELQVSWRAGERLDGTCGYPFTTM